MKLLLSLFLVAGIDNSSISVNLGEGIGKRGTAVPFVTLDAPNYDRPVTASGSFTLTGTSRGSGPVTWSTSPSGASGSCTGTASFSCVISVAPDAVGEGVETVTVTRGSKSDTQVVGFYFNGAHTAFLSQDPDGCYGCNFESGSFITTLETQGSSELTVTQSVEANKPKWFSNVVNGQPVIRCDGNDFLTAPTASDWTFVANGTSTTTEVVWQQTTASGSVYAVVGTAALLSSGRGFAIAMNDSTVNEGVRTYTWDAGNILRFISSVADVMPDGAFNLVSMLVAVDVAPAAPDVIQYSNNISTASSDQTFSSVTPSTGLTICASNSGGSNFPITGDIFRVIIYNGTALDATQRSINKAVDEWALGGPLPVTP